jgi:hypothetical protein
MNPGRVVHCKVESYDVYIGRDVDPNTGELPPRDWGNPFRLGRDGDRRSVIRRHRLHVLQRPHMVDMAREELKDRVLGCWCKPEDCHGDFLTVLASTVPVEHTDVGCSCYGERICDSCCGLYVCKFCGGAEGGLPSECPRVRLTGDQHDSVYAGLLNYIAGEWVEGCYDTTGKQNMPFWAGIVHVSERKKSTEVSVSSLTLNDK